MDILIIGAGHASVAIMREFGTVEAHAIIAVADVNADAPGMQEARMQGIATYTDFREMLQRHRYDMIFELTGVKKLFAQVKEECGNPEKVIPASVVRVVYDLIESFRSGRSQRAENAARISKEFGNLSRDLESAYGLIADSSERIRDLLEEARFISVNARIQSRKAGEYGRTFIPIVDKFTSLIVEIRNVLERIDKSGEKAQQASGNISAAEQKITSLFDANS